MNSLYTTRISFLLSAVLLLMISCGQFGKSGKYEDFYFLNQMSIQSNYDQAIDKAFQATGSNDLNVLVPSIVSAFRNLEILAIFREYNTVLNRDLIAAFEEYRGLLDGAFFHYYTAILYLQKGNKQKARQHISLFLKKYRKNNHLVKIAGNFSDLLNQRISDRKFWSLSPGPPEYLPIVLVSLEAFHHKSLTSDVSLMGHRSRDTDMVRLLSAVAHEQGAKAWKLYRSTKSLGEPIFEEKITLKLKNEAGDYKEIEKSYFNPFYYDAVYNLYRLVLRELINRYLNIDLQKTITQLDSLQAQRFFYLNLHLSRIYEFGLNAESEKLLNIVAATAVTPLQKKLAESNQHGFAVSGGHSIEYSRLHLPKDYNPFMQALLDIFHYRNLASPDWNFDEAQMEESASLIFDNAPDDRYRDNALEYLGEVYVATRNWKAAKTYLNYPVRGGFNIEKNDPVNLAYLSLALYNDKNQRSLSLWILKQIREQFRYANPLYANTQFVESARLLK